VERAAGGVLPGRGGVESFSPTPMLLAMRHFPEGTQGQSYWYHLDGRGSVAGISPSTRARARTTTGMMLTARFCRLRATGRTRTTITPLRAKSGMSTWACMNLAFGCMTPGRGYGGRGSRWRGMPGSLPPGTGMGMPLRTPSATTIRMGCKSRRRSASPVRFATPELCHHTMCSFLLPWCPFPHRVLALLPQDPNNHASGRISLRHGSDW
jgi:hypothetical protein